jgi:hypothetical protein
MTTGDLFKAITHNPYEHEMTDNIITDNYDTVIESLKAKDYNQIILLLYGGYPGTMPHYQKLLLSYGIRHNDEYLLTQTLTYFNKSQNMNVGDIFKYNYLPQFLNILENIEHNPYKFKHFQDYINDDLNILKLLLEHGYKICGYYVYITIRNNYTNALQYVFSVGYNVQKVFDGYIISSMTLEILKILIFNGICLKSNTGQIYYSFIRDNKLDCVKFLMSIEPCEHLDSCLNLCCTWSKYDILKYFISVGADIHKISCSNLIGTSVEIIKILVACGYQIEENTMNQILIYDFFSGCCVNDIIYFVENCGDINCIFESNNFAQKLVKIKNLDSLKYLITNYYELFDSKLKDVLWMACAENNCEVIKYLYDLIDLDCELLIIGCWFGHYDVVKLLVNYGLNFCDDEDFFVIVHDGIYRNDKIYDKLQKCQLFNKLHTYYSGNGQSDILKLLINHKVPVTNFDKIFNIYSEKFFDIDIIKYCVENGMDIHIVKMETCIYYRKYDLIRWLLDCGYVVNLSDGDWAVVNGGGELKKIFDEYGYVF